MSFNIQSTSSQHPVNIQLTSHHSYENPQARIKIDDSVTPTALNSRLCGRAWFRDASAAAAATKQIAHLLVNLHSPSWLRRRCLRSVLVLVALLLLVLVTRLALSVLPPPWVPRALPEPFPNPRAPTSLPTKSWAISGFVLLFLIRSRVLLEPC